MKKIHMRLVVSCAALFALCIASTVCSQGFVKYCNPRYGFCVEHPGGLSARPDPENSDGRAFYNAQGFELIVSGINNVNDETLESEMRSQINEFGNITYQAKKANWFVLSGYSGPDIVYRKTYVGKGSMNSLYIKYPTKMKARYDALTARISRSFTPGGLEEAH